MLHERMTTDDLFTALQALKDDKASDLINELLVHHLELEMQNRELRETQQQLAHSRTRYADLYDFSPIGYASLDENGFIEEINIIAGKLLGDNPHKLIGRPFSEFIATDEIQSFKDHLRRCRWSRKKRSIELQLVSQQSPPIDIQLFTMATQDADRHTLQFRTAMIDITIRKHAEAAVLETQKKLEQIVLERTAELTSERRQREDAQRFLYEASSALAMSLDYEITLWALARAGIPHLADGCMVDVVQEDGSLKRVATAHVNSEKEEILQNGDCITLAAEVIRSGQPELRDKMISVPLVIRGNTIGAIRLILERPDRSYNPFDLALAEDLADRAAIALDNATLYTKELEANRLKDEFLATVSHELRTPLTPILGAIYKLRASRTSDEDLQATLDIIERNTRAQARIVEELLDISRITAGKFNFNRQPIDLLPIIQRAIEVVRPSTEALGIHLQTSLEPLDRLIWCDRDRIQQVIWNLLSNAIKFTRQGGLIEVRLDSSPDWAHIRISDTGVGISPEFLPHVFDQFRQAGNFVTRMQGGLGAGLAIVRYIVERHGGTVRAESRGEGQGATFVVDLPYS
ncbi:MAG TPA: ATP-binding protein [Terriglobia bacterium]|nr:ATP-binding protein [Terriglobia bacterium]